MGIREEIQAADLPESVHAAFVAGLHHVADADGLEGTRERAAIYELVGDEPPDPSVLESTDLLWAHADLFVRACVYVALADGDYGVEEARIVSRFAHRLGISAQRLAELEASVFTLQRPR